MLNVIFSDEKIIENIRSDNGQQRDLALKYLYESHYKMAINIVKRKGGTEDEAEDVYQESIIALYECIRNDKFRGESKISTWLHSTIFNQWTLATRKSKKQQTKSIDDYSIEISSDDDINQNNDELISIIWKILDKIGESCKQVLLDYYYHRLSMKEIKEKMGFKTDQVAKNKRYRCKDKLDRFIKEKPGLKQQIDKLYYDRY